tara:strand:+ start:641 stop:1000 length:360 start_codon:yes stop_codon:yes gene_type:complete
MNKLLFLLALVITSCSVFNQNDFVKDTEIKTPNINLQLRYRLYKTGIDNFRYEFYNLDKLDTIEVLTCYLNDAPASNVKFTISEHIDTLIIASNYNLAGELQGKVNNVNIVLNYKPVNR